MSAAFTATIIIANITNTVNSLALFISLSPELGFPIDNHMSLLSYTAESLQNIIAKITEICKRAIVKIDFNMGF
jgi:hypothetical protein